MAGGGFVFSPACRHRKLRREQIRREESSHETHGFPADYRAPRAPGHHDALPAFPAARTCPCTTRCKAARFATCWRATNRARDLSPRAWRAPPGVPPCASAHPGPGATNLLTAIADAKLDSIPLIAITGQVPRNMIGTDAFQEVDTFGLSLPITKHNFLVRSAAELLEVIPRAFRIAVSGRAGPVLVDVPKDVQTESVDVASFPEPGRADPPPLCPADDLAPRRSHDQRGAKTASADRRRSDRRGRVERFASSNGEGGSAGGGHVARSGSVAP